MNAKKVKKPKKEQKKEEKSEEELQEEKHASLKKAGTIAQEVKNMLKKEAKVGVKALDLTNKAEKKIDELGGACAFPFNICINNIAAHYTPPLRNDNLTIQEGDIVKFDLGVHIDGYIVDTAFSLSFSEEKRLENIIQATEVAVDAAKMMVKPGVNTQKIGKKIESIIKGFKYNPIKELGGHQVERWTVHGKKSLPELGSQGGDEIEEGDVFAVEIFASTGEGTVHLTNNSYIYEMNPYAGRVPLRRKSSKRILGFVKRNYKTLPFAERWLGEEFKIGVAFGLQELVQQGKLKQHEVLAENKGEFVAQTEETVLVKEEGYEQLT